MTEGIGLPQAAQWTAPVPRDKVHTYDPANPDTMLCGVRWVPGGAQRRVRVPSFLYFAANESNDLMACRRCLRKVNPVNA